MENSELKWTSEEESALKEGVANHGNGNWSIILSDPEFAPRLADRTDVQLEEKWRSMCISHPQVYEENAQQFCSQNSNAPIVSKSTPGSVFTAQHADYSSLELDSSMYDTAIFEAISSLKDPNGSEVDAISGFIGQKYKVPENFRRILCSKLRRLVLQGKLVKLQNWYQIEDADCGLKTPLPEERVTRPSLSVEEAVEIAAIVAEAQRKSFEADEAIKESVRILEMVEHADLVLKVFEEMLEQRSWGRLA